MLFFYLSVTKTAKKAFFARKTIARQKHRADTCKKKLDTIVSDRIRYVHGNTKKMLNPFYTTKFSLTNFISQFFLTVYIYNFRQICPKFLIYTIKNI